MYDHEDVPTDEDMRVEAVRLEGLACELNAIARKLQRRYPSDALVEQAIERFLKSIESK